MNRIDKRGALASSPKPAAPAIFRGFRPMEEAPARKAEVKKDEKLEAILGSWNGFRKIELGLSPVESEVFRKACAIIGNARFGPPEGEKFSVMLPAYQDEARFDYMAGLFLSALVEMSAGDNFTIRTRGLTTKPSHLGCFNRKRLTIDGDAGNYLGCKMRKGFIRVRGNAEAMLGMNMIGGMMIVHGRAGHSIGLGMNGGQMIISKTTDRERLRIYDNIVQGKVTIEGKIVADKISIRFRQRHRRGSERKPKPKADTGPREYPEWVRGE
jgi:hypothetical protein